MLLTGTVRALACVIATLAGIRADSALTAAGDVYRNATLVIGATAAAGDREGFLAHPRGRVEYFSTSEDSGTPDVCFSSWVDHYEHHFSDGPLSKRAWAYQERLLARRFLSYNSEELLWECDSTWRCECGVGDALGQKSHPYHLGSLLKIGNAESTYRAWYSSVIRRYSGRNLTLSSDNLPAISGVAKLFQRKLHDRYVAGLWANDILEGILWKRIDGLMMQRSVIMPTSYCAPSWSWASVLSPVSYYESKLVRTYTVALNVECTPTGTDLTGRIRAGAAILYGPLVEAWVRICQGKFESTENLSLYLDPDRGSRAMCDFMTDCPLAIEEVIDLYGQVQWKARRIKSFEFDSDLVFEENANAEFKEARVYCLYIGIRHAGYERAYRGSCALVLSLSNADPGSFVRLGISNATSQAHDELFRNAKNQTVTII